jgi:hypothetical protein
MRGWLRMLLGTTLPAVAVAQTVRHEPLPQSARVAARTDQQVATSEALGAIDTAQGRIAAPPAGRPGDDTPVYAPGPPPRPGIDRRTGADGQLHYKVVFEPKIAPYKREYAFDRIERDLTFGRSGSGEEELPNTPQPTRPGHELFWGHIRLRLAAGQRAVLPSVAPTSRILRWQATPPANLRFFRDDAGNFSVGADTAADVDLRFLMDAPATYFGAPVSAEGRRDDPPVLPLEPGLKARAQALWAPLGVARSQSRKQQVDRLAEWFRGFTPGEPPAAGGDPLADLVLGQRGVCRHRAYGFAVLALSLGIPTHLVRNEAHAFVEVWVPIDVASPAGTGGWQRLDLGGGAESLTFHGEQGKRHHQPQWRDPFPQPPSYAAEMQNSPAPSAATASAGRTPGSASANGPLATAAGVGADAAAAAHGSAAHGVGWSPEEQRQRWLAERAQRVAAPQQPPRWGPPPRDARRATRVTLAVASSSAWVGEPLQVSGALRADGGRVARQAVEIWLIDPGEPTLGFLLGSAGTDAQGRFALAVVLPAEVELQGYDLVARFAGDAALRPSDSSW